MGSSRVRIDDPRDLHERLELAFEAINPRPAPIDSAVRGGKTIRVRRRVAAAVGIAAVVAVGVISIPSLHQLASPAPAAGSDRYTVTVQPPGPRSPAGLIASGTVNGKHWQLVADKPGADGVGRGNQQIYASGSAFGTGGGIPGIVPALRADPTVPVAFAEIASAPSEGRYGTVQADVSYVDVKLGNGIVLALHPVTVWGTRVVAFANPMHAVIVSATAYSRQGVIATAIPFNSPAGTASFGIWLKPGQHGPARASGLIGSGTVSGTAWSFSAYLGPWGVCLVSTGSSAGAFICGPSPDSQLGGSIMVSTGDNNTPGAAAGTVSLSVVRIVVHQSDGTTTQVRPVTIGGQKFFAFPTVKGPTGFSWTAYDASGAVVASSPS